MICHDCKKKIPTCENADGKRRCYLCAKKRAGWPASAEILPVRRGDLDELRARRGRVG